MSVGKVDNKGKARKLPIKADVRKALCFPGGSTLMIAHLNKEDLDNSANNLHLPSLFKAGDEKVLKNTSLTESEYFISVIN